jgi:peroxiredoxin
MRFRRNLAWLLLLCAVGCDRGAKPGLVGHPAPDFTIHDGAKTVTLSQLRGKVVLLNFWATWCAPCVEEIPAMEAMHQKMPQLEVLAVSLDHDGDAYNRFLATNPLPFDLIRDPAEASASLYGTDGYPETFVIDAHGIVRRHFVGPVDWDSPAILGYLRSL